MSSSVSTTKTHSNEQSNEEEEASAQSRLENVLCVLLKNFFRCSRKNILHDRISLGKIVPKKSFPSGKNVLPWLLSFKNILQTFGLEKLTSLTTSILSGMKILVESYALVFVVLSVRMLYTFFSDLLLPTYARFCLLPLSTFVLLIVIHKSSYEVVVRKLSYLLSSPIFYLLHSFFFFSYFVSSSIVVFFFFAASILRVFFVFLKTKKR